MKQTPWTRDELILALDLYFRYHPSTINRNHQAVIELSQLLNQLPLHATRHEQPNFRSANAVYMKLQNFNSLDPSHQAKGLDKASQPDRDAWAEFADDQARLAAAAAAIRKNYGAISSSSASDTIDIEEEFPEGSILLLTHHLRERNRGLVQKKKQQVLAHTGRIACEICEFDFEAVYGPLGKGFAECHHLVPVAALEPESTTRLSDLAVVCANCHRMLHRGKPLLTVTELRELTAVSSRQQDPPLE